LVTLHYEFVWRVLRGLGLSDPDAEDAAQQVFMTVARKFDTIEPSRERSFVYGTALRVAQNMRRGLRRSRKVLEPEQEEHDIAAPAGQGPERATELGKARVLLSDLLQQLPDKLRRVIVLAEIEQLEVQEIAALEGLPVGTAASRLRSARQQFRLLLEAAGDRNPFLSET
jgi:RNA polymerase sigma-70 factor (ECF subfamily)